MCARAPSRALVIFASLIIVAMFHLHIESRRPGKQVSAGPGGFHSARPTRASAFVTVRSRQERLGTRSIGENENAVLVLADT